MTKWSEEEFQFLRDNYLSMTHAEMAEKLNRPIKSVQEFCSRLKLRKNPALWTEEEYQFLRDNFDKMSYTEISKHLKRPVNSVSLYCQRLNLTKQPHMKWTKEEDALLCKYYPTHTVNELLSLFPNRTEHSLGNRIRVLKISKRKLSQ